MASISPLPNIRARSLQGEGAIEKGGAARNTHASDVPTGPTGGECGGEETDLGGRRAVISPGMGQDAIGVRCSVHGGGIGERGARKIGRDGLERAA